jgi:hypothetical protein
MNVMRLGWMGTKPRQFDRMNTFYRDVLSLEVLSIDDESGRFRLDDGTEVHVYGPQDQDHEFFGSGPDGRDRLLVHRRCLEDWQPSQRCRLTPRSSGLRETR